MFPDFFRFLLYRYPRKCGKMRKKSKSFLEPAIFMNSSKICVYSLIFDFFMIFIDFFQNFREFSRIVMILGHVLCKNRSFVGYEIRNRILKGSWAWVSLKFSWNHRNPRGNPPKKRLNMSWNHRNERGSGKFMRKNVHKKLPVSTFYNWKRSCRSAKNAINSCRSLLFIIENAAAGQVFF